MSIRFSIIPIRYKRTFFSLLRPIWPNSLLLPLRRRACPGTERHRALALLCGSERSRPTFEITSAREIYRSVVAARHRVNPRYVQRLFEAEGATFSEFVLTERLMRVYQLLADPICQHLKVSEIAYQTGFSDLSYFNRSFRQRFGTTPSDIRMEALGRR